jgi:hypothetical protein
MVPLVNSLVPLGLLAAVSLGCAAVFPEVSTPLRAPPAGYSLEPAPPADVVYVHFEGAVIPKKTRDGRRWDSVGGEAPDPYAKLLVNGKEVIVTPIQSDTVTPTWPDQERANYRIRPTDVVVVQLWDSNPLNNHPICSQKIVDFVGAATSDQPTLEVNCDNGGRVVLVVRPARGKLGLGFFYEVGANAAHVTRVLESSPAGRAGLAVGDELVRVQGVDVRTMEDGRLKSLINSHATLGLELVLKSSSGKEKRVTLREGAVYPLESEGIPLD